MICNNEMTSYSKSLEFTNTCDTGEINLANELPNFSFPTEGKPYVAEISTKVIFVDKSSLPNYLYVQFITNNNSTELPDATEKNTIHKDKIIDSDTATATATEKFYLKKDTYISAYPDTFPSSNGDFITFRCKITRSDKTSAVDDNIDKIEITMKITFANTYNYVTNGVQRKGIGFGKFNYISVGMLHKNIPIPDTIKPGDWFDVWLDLQYTDLAVNVTKHIEDDTKVNDYKTKVILLSQTHALTDNENHVETTGDYNYYKTNIGLAFCDQHELQMNTSSVNEKVKLSCKKLQNHTHLHVDLVTNTVKQYLTTLTIKYDKSVLENNYDLTYVDGKYKHTNYDGAIKQNEGFHFHPHTSFPVLKINFSKAKVGIVGSKVFPNNYIMNVMRSSFNQLDTHTISKNVHGINAPKTNVDGESNTNSYYVDGQGQPDYGVKVIKTPNDYTFRNVDSAITKDIVSTYNISCKKVMNTGLFITQYNTNDISEEHRIPTIYGVDLNPWAEIEDQHVYETRLIFQDEAYIFGDRSDLKIDNYGDFTTTKVLEGTLQNEVINTRTAWSFRTKFTGKLVSKGEAGSSYRHMLVDNINPYKFRTFYQTTGLLYGGYWNNYRSFYKDKKGYHTINLTYPDNEPEEVQLVEITRQEDMRAYYEIKNNSLTVTVPQSLKIENMHDFSITLYTPGKEIREIHCKFKQNGQELFYLTYDIILESPFSNSVTQRLNLSDSFPYIKPTSSFPVDEDGNLVIEVYTVDDRGIESIAVSQNITVATYLSITEINSNYILKPNTTFDKEPIKMELQYYDFMKNIFQMAGTFDAFIVLNSVHTMSNNVKFQINELTIQLDYIGSDGSIIKKIGQKKKSFDSYSISHIYVSFPIGLQSFSSNNDKSKLKLTITTSNTDVRIRSTYIQDNIIPTYSSLYESDPDNESILIPFPYKDILPTRTYYLNQNNSIKIGTFTYPSDTKAFPIGYKLPCSLLIVFNSITPIEFDSFKIKDIMNNVESFNSITKLIAYNAKNHMRIMRQRTPFDIHMDFFDSEISSSDSSIQINNFQIGINNIPDNEKTQKPELGSDRVKCVTNNGDIGSNHVRHVEFEITNVETPGWIIIKINGTFLYNHGYSSVSNVQHTFDTNYIIPGETLTLGINISNDYTYPNGTDYNVEISQKSGFNVDSEVTIVTIHKQTTIPNINFTKITLKDNFISTYNYTNFTIKSINNGPYGSHVEYKKLLYLHVNKHSPLEFIDTFKKNHDGTERLYPGFPLMVNWLKDALTTEVDKFTHDTTVTFKYKIIDKYLNASDEKDLITIPFNTVLPDSKFKITDSYNNNSKVLVVDKVEPVKNGDIYIENSRSNYNLKLYQADANAETTRAIFEWPNSARILTLNPYGSNEIPKFELVVTDQYLNSNITTVDGFTINDTIFQHQSNVVRYSLTNPILNNAFISKPNTITLTNDYDYSLNNVLGTHIFKYGVQSNGVIHDIHRKVEVVDRHPPDIKYFVDFIEQDLESLKIQHDNDYASLSNLIIKVDDAVDGIQELNFPFRSNVNKTPLQNANLFYSNYTTLPVTYSNFTDSNFIFNDITKGNFKSTHIFYDSSGNSSTLEENITIREKPRPSNYGVHIVHDSNENKLKFKTSNMQLGDYIILSNDTTQLLNDRITTGQESGYVFFSNDFWGYGMNEYSIDMRDKFGTYGDVIQLPCIKYEESYYNLLVEHRSNVDRYGFVNNLYSNVTVSYATDGWSNIVTTGLDSNDINYKGRVTYEASNATSKTTIHRKVEVVDRYPPDIIGTNIGSVNDYASLSNLLIKVDDAVDGIQYIDFPFRCNLEKTPLQNTNLFYSNYTDLPVTYSNFTDSNFIFNDLTKGDFESIHRFYDSSGNSSTLEENITIREKPRPSNYGVHIVHDSNENKLKFKTSNMQLGDYIILSNDTTQLLNDRITTGQESGYVFFSNDFWGYGMNEYSIDMRDKFGTYGDVIQLPCIKYEESYYNLLVEHRSNVDRYGFVNNLYSNVTVSYATDGWSNIVTTGLDSNDINYKGRVTYEASNATSKTTIHREVEVVDRYPPDMYYDPILEITKYFGNIRTNKNQLIVPTEGEDVKNFNCIFKINNIKIHPKLNYRYNGSHIVGQEDGLRLTVYIHTDGYLRFFVSVKTNNSNSSTFTYLRYEELENKFIKVQVQVNIDNSNIRITYGDNVSTQKAGERSFLFTRGSNVPLCDYLFIGRSSYLPRDEFAHDDLQIYDFEIEFYNGRKINKYDTNIYKLYRRLTLVEYNNDTEKEDSDLIDLIVFFKKYQEYYYFEEIESPWVVTSSTFLKIQHDNDYASLSNLIIKVDDAVDGIQHIDFPFRCNLEKTPLQNTNLFYSNYTTLPVTYSNFIGSYFKLNDETLEDTYTSTHTFFDSSGNMSTLEENITIGSKPPPTNYGVHIVHDSNENKLNFKTSNMQLGDYIILSNDTYGVIEPISKSRITDVSEQSGLIFFTSNDFLGYGMNEYSIDMRDKFGTYGGLIQLPCIKYEESCCNLLVEHRSNVDRYGFSNNLYSNVEILNDTGSNINIEGLDSNNINYKGRVTYEASNSTSKITIHRDVEVVDRYLPEIYHESHHHTKYFKDWTTNKHQFIIPTRGNNISNFSCIFKLKNIESVSTQVEYYIIGQESGLQLTAFTKKGDEYLYFWVEYKGGGAIKYNKKTDLKNKYIKIEINTNNTKFSITISESDTLSSSYTQTLNEEFYIGTNNIAYNYLFIGRGGYLIKERFANDNLEIYEFQVNIGDETYNQDTSYIYETGSAIYNDKIISMYNDQELVFFFKQISESETNIIKTETLIDMVHIINEFQLNHMYLTLNETLLKIDDAVDGEYYLNLDSLNIATSNTYTNLQNDRIQYKYESNNALLDYRNVLFDIENTKTNPKSVVQAQPTLTNINVKNNYNEKLFIKDGSDNIVELSLSNQFLTLDDDLSIQYTHSNLIVYSQQSNNQNDEKSLSNLTYNDYKSREHIDSIIFSNIYRDVYNEYLQNNGYSNTVNSLDVEYTLHSNSSVQPSIQSFNSSNVIHNNLSYKTGDFKYRINTKITDIRKYTSNTTMNIYFSPSNYTTITNTDYLLSNSDNIFQTDEFKLQYMNYNQSLYNEYFVDVSYSNVLDNVLTSNTHIQLRGKTDITGRSNLTIRNLLSVNDTFKDSVVEGKYNIGYELDGFLIIGNENTSHDDFRIIYNDKVPRPNYIFKDDVYFSNVNIENKDDSNLLHQYNKFDFTTDFQINMSNYSQYDKYTQIISNVFVKKDNEHDNDYESFGSPAVFSDGLSNIQKYVVKYEILTTDVGTQKDFTFNLNRIPYGYKVYNEEKDTTSGFSIFESDSLLKLNIGLIDDRPDKLLCSYNRSKFDIEPLVKVNNYDNNVYNFVDRHGKDYNAISLKVNDKYLHYDSNTPELSFKNSNSIMSDTEKSNCTFPIYSCNNYDYFIKTIDDKYYLSNDQDFQTVELSDNTWSTYNILSNVNERLYNSNNISFSVNNPDANVKNKLMILIEKKQIDDIETKQKKFDSNKYKLLASNIEITTDIGDRNVFDYDEKYKILVLDSSNITKGNYGAHDIQLHLGKYVSVVDDINKITPDFVSPDDISQGTLKVFKNDSKSKRLYNNSKIVESNLYVVDSYTTQMSNMSQLIIKQDNENSKAELKYSLENFAENNSNDYYVQLSDRFKNGKINMNLIQYNIAHESNILPLELDVDKENLISCKVQ